VSICTLASKLGEDASILSERTEELLRAEEGTWRSAGHGVVVFVLEVLNREDTLAFKPCGAGDARGESGGDDAGTALRGGCGDGEAA